MLDKGKYASHGAFIKKLPSSAAAQRHKPKLAVIHPLPTNQARTAQKDNQLQGTVLQSKTYSAKFRFQENIDRQPVAQTLVQPFLYIEKVIKKQTVDQKLADMKHPQPFVTSSSMRPRKTKKDKDPAPKASPFPQGFNSLYDYEEERRKIANKLFQKMLEGNVQNLKDMFLLWTGKNKKWSPEIDIKESQFIDFIKEVLPGKIAEKQIKYFFELYKNQVPKGREKDEQFRSISVKALSFNYEKFRKGQIEVSNIISVKSLKERYLWVKNYLSEFDANYPDLKAAMNSIKQYEQSLKNHFRQLFNSYKNPYQSEIEQLQRELEKPIIKYDKLKKNELNGRVETLTAKHEALYQQLTQDFTNFMEQYESAILLNHDLFFTKRILCKLLLGPLGNNPTLTRSMLEEEVAKEQEKKESFLECLSDLVVELDKDKKHLGEDCFTLEEFVQLVLMKNKKNKNPQFPDEFILYSSKKLIKEVKKQFLLKHSLDVQSLQEFPADQQIPLDLLHSCFEMECTKVLFKNQIWQELLNFIPTECQQSQLHQKTIEGNLCLELVRRYFCKLDQRIKVELSKSKQISLLAENVSLQQFGKFSTVIEGVLNQINNYVEDEDQDEKADKVEPLKEKGRVTFGDIVDLSLQNNNNNNVQSIQPESAESQQAQLQKEQEQNVIKGLIKSIFEGQTKQPPQQAQILIEAPSQFKQPTIAQNFIDSNSLAKSIFEAEGLNTNSFDIRYYEKEREKHEKPQQTEVVRMGSSILLSNLPHVNQLETSPDPLKISRLLMTTIDKGIKEERKVVREQPYQKNIVEGVSSNYYKDKIKLENKPTIYDSQGKSKYSVLMPVGYYQNFVSAENVPEADKWYLRPHHVQTLTENPLSKKDNVIHTEYQSKLDKLPPKKRPDEYVIEENVKRKSELIQSLEERLSSLKNDLANANRGSRVEGAKVSPVIVDNYLSKLTEDKQDKDLEIASYEGVLYDLRRKERGLLNEYRERESGVVGDPGEKWWERKDKDFNVELKKERLLAADEISGTYRHRQYVDKLKNSEIY